MPTSKKKKGGKKKGKHPREREGHREGPPAAATAAAGQNGLIVKAGVGRAVRRPKKERIAQAAKDLAESGPWVRGVGVFPSPGANSGAGGLPSPKELKRRLALAAGAGSDDPADPYNSLSGESSVIGMEGFHDESELSGTSSMPRRERHHPSDYQHNGVPVVSIAEMTGISSTLVPQPLSTVIPVFVHSDRKTRDIRKPSVIRMMTPGQVRSEYGSDAFGAMGDAFHNFTSDRGCFPGMGVGETYRHGLALYLIQQPADGAPPMSELSDLVASFNGRNQCDILEELIDPEHFGRVRPQVRVAVAIREKHPVMHIVVAMVLTQTMDIWHSHNKDSPGHHKLLQPLRKKMARFKKRESAAADCVEQLEPAETDADIAARQADEALDDEFAALTFEQVLAQEKEIGAFP